MKCFCSVLLMAITTTMSSKQPPNAATIQSSGMWTPSTGTVSYTHLDVYKRQLQMTYVNIHHPSSLKNGIEETPNMFKIWLTVPPCCENRLVAIPATTTQETKCGKYRMDCVTFLNFALMISLSIRDTIIVSGKLTASVNRFRLNVFRTTNQKFLLSKIF